MNNVLLAVLLLMTPYRIVLRDGSSVDAQGPAKRSGSVMLIRTPSGMLTSLPAEEIDQAATEKANAPKPTPVPVAAPSTAKRIEITGSSSGTSPTYTTSASTAAGSTGGPVQVRGYTNSHGTYVAPYSRSAPSHSGKK